MSWLEGLMVGSLFFNSMAAARAWKRQDAIGTGIFVAGFTCCVLVLSGAVQ